MPQLNLGNIKGFSEGAGLYNHTYDTLTKIHNFTGIGRFGYCKCLANYSAGDIVQVNGVEVSIITIPTFIVENAWIVFIISDDVFYMLDKAEMFHIPDGEIVEPVNSPEIWCACAGINWREIGSPDAYTLASSSYCPELFNNPNAFAYYRRSNEIIAATMSDTNVISSIESLEYYTTPYMTAANTPTGYSSTGSDTQYKDSGSAAAWKGFANGNYIADNCGKAGDWVQLIIPEPIWPYKMQIHANGRWSTSHMLTGAIFKWQCSNDGNNWIDLDTLSTLSTTTNVWYTFYNKTGITGKYKYFRLYVAQSSNTAYWNCGDGQVSGIL
jgi:hypothetical protein